MIDKQDTTTIDLNSIQKPEYNTFLSQKSSESVNQLLTALRKEEVQQKMATASNSTSDDTEKYSQPSKSGQGLLLPVPIVIAVHGLPRSGKDYLSQYFWNKYCNTAVIPYSSLMIREINNYLTDLDLSLINENNKSIPEVRSFIIAWANSRRSLESDYWTRQLTNLIDQRFSEGCQLIFLPGARYQTDVDCLTAYKHYLWETIRPDNSYSFKENNDSLKADQTIINDHSFLSNAQEQLNIIIK
jgi:hypothetical protein